MEWVNEEFKKLRYIVNTISADVGVPSLPPVLPTLPLGDNQSQQLSITDVSDAAITYQAEETGNATPLTPSDADPHNTSSAIDTHVTPSDPTEVTVTDSNNTASPQRQSVDEKTTTKTLNDLCRQVTSLKGAACSQHDTAISAVRDLQKEVKELLKVRLREVKEDFKQGLDVLRKRVDNLEAENLKLKSQVGQQKQTIASLQQIATPKQTVKLSRDTQTEAGPPQPQRRPSPASSRSLPLPPPISFRQTRSQQLFVPPTIQPAGQYRYVFRQIP
ncbi:hypothetical protein BaRGS_00037811 [Batillaria attramentaria]|uniref:Uncharacterized protein n=1 Tax=Batillaria attramentaria TaxID=370345 RepID=A0ABD0J839_9CAEN